jgi:putative ubiquitin-RnfH superfamily antitoxin RatB of RatAB toxin-antitoxin module
MAPVDARAPIRVTVGCSPVEGVAEELGLTLPAGATLGEALRASGVLERHPQFDPARQAVGIWGRVCALDTVLKEGDRVEIYRPLQVDPKEARRRRQRLQREAAATCSPRR